MNNNPIQKNTTDMLKEADELLANIRQANTDFKQKTDGIITDINEKVDTATKDFNKTEKELKKFEKDTINEIDKIIIESVS